MSRTPLKSVQSFAINFLGYHYSEDNVVVTGKVITSRGPGTAFDFALKLVELLVSAEKVKEISAPMMLK